MDSSDDTRLAIGDACNPLILPLILWGVGFLFYGKSILTQNPIGEDYEIFSLLKFL